MRVCHRGAAAAAAIVLGLLCSPASAVSLGQADTFQSGVEGWSAGGNSPSPPSWNPSGFMEVTALGGLGAGSRLVVFNAGQWAGDYAAAGITALTMDLSNLGNTDLSLRLRLAGTQLGQAVISTEAVVLPAGSGWRTVSFSLAPAALTGAAAAVLGDVTELRLFHSPGAAFPGPAIAATLAVDNITAVPEPASALTLLLGLAAVAAAGRRDRRPA